MRHSLALLTFGSALVASVATSPAGWNLERSGDGAEFTLDAENPTTDLGVQVAADLDSDTLANAWAEVSVAITVLEVAAVDVDAPPPTLDFVLYEVDDRGEREIDAVRGWTLAPATEEIPNPEVVSLVYSDFGRGGEARVRVTIAEGGSARLDWAAYAWLDYSGEAAHPGDDALQLTLVPSAE